MKKVMIADLIKDITDSYLEERALRIKDLTDQFNINKVDATYIVDNYNNYDDQENVAQIMERYDCSVGNAEIFYKDYPNPSEWDDVDATAEALGIDPLDVTPDEVEAFSEIWDLGGSRGSSHIEVESSIGKFIITSGAYGLTLAVLFPDECKWSRYGTISKETARDLINADSAGEYYNLNIRGNSQYSEMPGSCGCKGRLKKDIEDIVCDDSFSQDLPQDIQQIIKYIC